MRPSYPPFPTCPGTPGHQIGQAHDHSQKHNVECDQLAKKYVTQIPQRSTSLPKPEIEAANHTFQLRGK